MVGERLRPQATVLTQRRGACKDATTLVLGEDHMLGPRKPSISLQPLLIIAVLTVAGVVSRAHADQLTGTATYTGAKGTVSSATRIRVHAYCLASVVT